jgi:hypothetical protein
MIMICVTVCKVLNSLNLSSTSIQVSAFNHDLRMLQPVMNHDVVEDSRELRLAITFES